jgi:site-specific DNA recombinase
MENQINKERAIIYCRVSTEEQREFGASLNQQLEALQKYCKEKKFDVVEEIVTDESASKEGRKNFSRMIKRVQNDNILNVIIWSTSRLSRNPEDRLLIKHLTEKGFKFHIVRENHIMNPDLYDEVMVDDIKAAVDIREAKELARRTKDGMQYNFSHGKWIGIAPVGYKNIVLENGKKDIVIDEERAPFVVQAFELYNSGLSLRKLTKKLAELGLRSRETPKKPPKKPWDEMTKHEQEFEKTKEEKRRRSQPFSLRGVGRILKDTFYHGLMKMNGTFKEHQYGNLITKELFDRVQEMMKENQRNMAAERRPNETFPFRQFTKCGYCGLKITSGRSFKKLASGKVEEYDYYFCSKEKDPACPQKHYKASEIDELVSSGVKNISMEFDTFEKLRRQIEKANIEQEGENKKGLKKLGADLAKEKGKIEILYDDRLSGRISGELYDKKVKEVQKRIVEIEDEIAKAENKINPLWREQSLAVVQAFIKFKDGYSRLDARGKARMLDGVLEKAIIKNGQVEHIWREPWKSIFEYSEELEERARDNWDNPSHSVEEESGVPLTPFDLLNPP